MQIVFDEAFDGTAWPGPLGDGAENAVFGRVWVGTLGLLGQLETGLGLSVPTATAAERAAALIPALRAREGYWSRSLAADPFGTARRVLAERDALWACGWRGQGVSPRLELLAEVARDVLPGVADRLSTVADRLRGRDAEIGTIALLEDPTSLSPSWRAVVDALVRRGVEIVQWTPDKAPPRGDLGKARGVPFTPEADGSLQLIRAHGPVAAADDVAAWLAAQPSTERTVIIGGDEVLDRALAAHGRPTTGATVDDGALLQTLPLVIALGWQPSDPDVAHQLLLLRESPIPRRLARRLARALHRWPAVDSDSWRRSAREAIDAIEDESLRAKTSARMATVFSQVVPRSAPYPVDELVKRVDCVCAWAGERQRASADPWRYDPIIEQCRVLTRVVSLAQLDELSAPDLRRVLALALEELPRARAFDREAGIVAVAGPEAVAGPAARIVWWSFRRDAAPALRRLPLSEHERERLAAAGIVLPDPGREAVRLARRYRRPLLCAEDVLLLVCPRTGVEGVELHPHPLWDELEASCPAELEPALIERLVRETPDLLHPSPRLPGALRPLPRPTREFQVEAGQIGVRETESPSGLDAVLSCPLRWTLRYFGRLSSGLGEPLSGVSALAIGSLAHQLFNRLFTADGLPTADEAATSIGASFDAEGPRLNASMFLPGRETLRRDFRQRLTAAARVLVGHIEDAGAVVRSSEEGYQLAALGSTLRGIPDLVLASPPAVVDLKWSGRQRHTSALADGAALQLAAYSMLTHSGSGTPASVAYFILRNQELLVGSGSCFRRTTAIDGPTPARTWQGALAAHARIRAELDEGFVVAAGNADDEGGGVVGSSELRGDELALEAPCAYCEYDLLCGAGAEEAS